MEYAKDEIFTIEYSKQKPKRINRNNILGLLFSIGGIFCIANSIAIAVKAFSPPDSSIIFCSFFPGG